MNMSLKVKKVIDVPNENSRTSFTNKMQLV